MSWPAVLRLIGSALMVVLPAACSNSLDLPDVLGDGMVLQRDRTVPVWGKASVAAEVAVTFAGVETKTKADAAGHWRVSIATGPASAIGRTVKVAETGGETIELTDVLVGEVWHASGQSNMQWRVDRSMNAEAEIAAGDHPAIRIFNQPRGSMLQEDAGTAGSWVACSPETLGSQPAVAYYFARQLKAELGVPIGVIATPWGGATVEAFMSPRTLATVPGGPAFVEKYSKKQDAVANDDPRRPFHLYYGMILPVAPFGKRGVIWYQGESNAGRAVNYDALMRSLIEEWRALWNQPNAHRDFPFLTVQLANYGPPVEYPSSVGWAALRSAQSMTAANHPNTYLATAIDVGEEDDIHPRNKQEVGRRLALIALRRVYGLDGFMDRGPTLIDAVPTTPDEHGYERMRIELADADGLATTDGLPPRGLAVRNVDDGRWRWALTVKIVDEGLLVSAPIGVKAPFALRYAMGKNPSGGPHAINLVNGDGLPAYPFDWKP